MTNFIIDIPGIKNTSGGIQRMLEFSEVLFLYYPSYVTIKGEAIDQIKDGYIVTFSDNPNINELCSKAKEQNLRVIVYQLSYGMAIDRERKVVSHPDVIVCTSTEHIRQKILNDPNVNIKNKQIYCISHSQEETLKNFFPEDKYYFNINFRDENQYQHLFLNQFNNPNRQFDVALMMHKSPDKRFKESFEYCKSQDLKIVLFGARLNQDLSGTEQIFFNASAETVRWIFNNSKKFLNASLTEGLNRTGIEAMLCGCKPYIYDGCEIYQDEQNCKFIKNFEEIHENFELIDYIKIKKSLESYTWKNVLKNLGKILKIKFDKKDKK